MARPRQAGPCRGFALLGALLGAAVLASLPARVRADAESINVCPAAKWKVRAIF